MIEDIKRQVQAAGGKLAGRKAKAKPAGQKRYGGKNTPQTQEGVPAEEEEVESTEPVTPNPRYYQSSTRTPEGLHMDRLVAYSAHQWDALEPLLQQLGSRPY